MEIIKLEKGHLDEALRLVWDTFLRFEAHDYSEEGVKTFYDFISDKNAVGSLDFFGAFENGSLLGVIAVRNMCHITLFFVSAENQRKGIGRRLWEHVRDMGGERFTVNSSPYAVPVYLKLGFAPLGGEKTTDGMRYTPMEYVISSRETE